MKLIAKLADAFDTLSDFTVYMMIALLLLLGGVGAGYFNGKHAAERASAKQITELSGHIRRVNAAYELALSSKDKADKLVYAALQSDFDTLKQNRSITQTIIKEVPKYVTPTSDARCVIPAGFVQVHDATAATNPAPLPGSATGDVDAASGVALSTVAEVVASNNAECVERGRILELWQRWYPASKENYERASALMQGAALQ